MKTKIFTLVLLSILFFVSCSDDEEIIKQSLTYVNVRFPKSVKNKNPRIKTATFVLTNVNTGNKITRQVETLPVSYFKVEDGLYNISVTGIMEYDTQTTEGKSVTKTLEVRALQENAEIIGGNFNATLEFLMYSPSDSFVISEIFFSRTTTPEGKPYLNDAFIEIYNNSNKILYADGLCVAETFLQTVDALNEMEPDFRSTKVSVKDVYRIPGSGKDYPIKPGETILLCDMAINHKTHNTNSFDLSKANFEWFDGTDVDDIDVPEVPNLEKMISTNGGTWNLNVNGNNSYILFRLPDKTTPEAFLKNNALTFKHKFIFGSYNQTFSENTWAVVNQNVIDAVQVSVPGEFKWSVMSPDLDLSWTYATKTSGYNGLSVRRKVSYKEGERIVLQDTNDSAFDFIPTAIPSPKVIETE